MTTNENRTDGGRDLRAVLSTPLPPHVWITRKVDQNTGGPGLGVVEADVPYVTSHVMYVRCRTCTWIRLVLWEGVARLKLVFQPTTKGALR